MLIDYSVTRTFNETIDVVDIGNTCLRCTSDEGDEYYIITRTLAGKFHMISFGPVIDADILCNSFNFNYTKIDYKEKKIFKAISNFINDPYKSISNVEEITEYEGLQQLPNIQEAFGNL